MPRKVDYKCPECQGIFEFLHHPSDEPPPDYCPLCKAYVGDDPMQRQPVLSINLGTEKNSVGDKLYRQMESASDANAQAAAEMVGADKADMSAIRITNLNDNTREGEHAAMTRAAQAERELSYTVAGNKVAPTLQNPNAAAWAAETRSGTAALSTRQFIDQSQASGHMRAMANQVTAAGRFNKA